VRKRTLWDDVARRHGLGQSPLENWNSSIYAYSDVSEQTEPAGIQRVFLKKEAAMKNTTDPLENFEPDNPWIDVIAGTVGVATIVGLIVWNLAG
jgi:hypothetical protein